MSCGCLTWYVVSGLRSHVVGFIAVWLKRRLLGEPPLTAYPLSWQLQSLCPTAGRPPIVSSKGAPTRPEYHKDKTKQ
eukprot:4670587-Amphidinium_carterae.1